MYTHPRDIPRGTWTSSRTMRARCSNKRSGPTCVRIKHETLVRDNPQRKFPTSQKRFRLILQRMLIGGNLEFIYTRNWIRNSRESHSEKRVT